MLKKVILILVIIASLTACSKKNDEIGRENEEVKKNDNRPGYATIYTDYFAGETETIKLTKDMIYNISISVEDEKKEIPNRLYLWMENNAKNPESNNTDIVMEDNVESCNSKDLIKEYGVTLYKEVNETRYITQEQFDNIVDLINVEKMVQTENNMSSTKKKYNKKNEVRYESLTISISYNDKPYYLEFESPNNMLDIFKEMDKLRKY